MNLSHIAKCFVSNARSDWSRVVPDRMTENKYWRSVRLDFFIGEFYRRVLVEHVEVENINLFY
jgi:hypothetical protein